MFLLPMFSASLRMQEVMLMMEVIGAMGMMGTTEMMKLLVTSGMTAMMTQLTTTVATTVASTRETSAPTTSTAARPPMITTS